MWWPHEENLSIVKNVKKKYEIITTILLGIYFKFLKFYCYDTFKYQVCFRHFSLRDLGSVSMRVSVYELTNQMCARVFFECRVSQV